MEIKPITPEKIAQIKAMLKEMDITPSNHSIIQDNKVIFPFKDKWYRVRMPNQMEQTLAEKKQSQMKIKLAQELDSDGNPVNVSRNNWIKILKENQDFDVIEKEKEQEKIKEELRDAYLEMAVIPSDDKLRIEENRKKKDEIESRFMELTIELIEMLAPCIQEQAKIEYYRYLSYACAEEQVNENEYKPVWLSYEDYGKDESGLSILVLQNIQELLLSIKE